MFNLNRNGVVVECLESRKAAELGHAKEQTIGLLGLVKVLLSAKLFGLKHAELFDDLVNLAVVITSGISETDGQASDENRWHFHRAPRKASLSDRTTSPSGPDAVKLERPVAESPLQSPTASGPRCKLSLIDRRLRSGEFKAGRSCLKSFGLSP